MNSINPREMVLSQPKTKGLIQGFFGTYRWLSNFHLCEVQFEEVIYPSSENAYQAAKSASKVLREQFKDITPIEAKKLGKSIPLRSDWEQVKLQVMETILLDKFTRNLDLKEKLINTNNNILIEVNWWEDRFWGVNPRGEGLNHLGKILMKIREQLSDKE